MTTYVFEFYNLYIPEGTVYQNDAFNIRIEPEPIVEDFEDQRRSSGSQYRTGYWHTAQCYIDADEDRAKELADWLTFIYSFAQNRDVTWSRFYPLGEGNGLRAHRSTYTFAMDNTNLRFISWVWGQPGDKGIGEFVDTALQTFDEASENERSRLIRSLSLFLEANSDTFWMIKFLFHWIVLESNANYNYDDYLQGPGDPIFTDDEIETMAASVIDYLEGEWAEDKVAHMEYVLRLKHLYEASSKTKIKIFLEHLNIGFDIDEIEEIIQVARSARNPLVHRIDESRLMNNDDVVIDIQKINFYVLLRLLGVDEDLQERLITPTIMGPDIHRDED